MIFYIFIFKIEIWYCCVFKFIEDLFIGFIYDVGEYIKVILVSYFNNDFFNFIFSGFIDDFI